jgi:hypothetical protein
MTIALPLNAQFNTGDHNQPASGGRKHHAQVLALPGITIQRIFWIGAPIRFAFAKIDFAPFQYFPDLFFRNVPAIHPAPGVTRVHEMSFMPVDGNISLHCLITLW